MLRIATTRGDRLFIIAARRAFIHLAWLGLVGPDLWWALGLSLVYAVAVFRCGLRARPNEVAGRVAEGTGRSRRRRSQQGGNQHAHAIIATVVP